MGRDSSYYESSREEEPEEERGSSRNRQRVSKSIEDIMDYSENVEDDSFAYSEGLTTGEAKLRLEKYGRNELPDEGVSKVYLFFQQLWQPMPVMMWIAIIVEAAIQNWLDMGVLLFIQIANACIGFYELNKAGNAVKALKTALVQKATVKRDGKMIAINAALLVPGDLVLLASGSAVPADCRVNEGVVEVDQAALTGESLPVTFFRGDAPKMGSTVVRGETEATVEFTGVDTFFGKTAKLLVPTNEFTSLQKLLISLVSSLVALSVLLCLVVLIYTSTIVPFEEALSFTVVVLVASIPMAVEIVTTTTLALGSKELARKGAIVTRLSAIEDLAAMSILCSDKTGTLTMNKMVIQAETPVYKEGMTQRMLLRYAAMAAKWKEPPRDALDTLVLTTADLTELDNVEQKDFLPFDPVFKRTEGTVEVTTSNKEFGEKRRDTFKTTKGAPHVIIELCKMDLPIKRQVQGDVTSLGQRGIRCLAVAKTGSRGDWEFLGLLTFLDPPRPDTKDTIAAARENGVVVKMITGDHLLIAKETARQLNLGDDIQGPGNLPMLTEDSKKPDNLARDYGDMCLASDGFAQVFPEHKYLIVECLREMGFKVGMTGDGVNDAPALQRADVGVAVQGATDAANAAADIILTEPGLKTIVDGVVIARRIFVRIRNFLTYRIAATLQLLLFFFVALFAMPPVDYMPSDWEARHEAGTFPDDRAWPEFFHLPVMMLMLITLLNDGTLIAIGYDRVEANPEPEKWNKRILFASSFLLAIVALGSSLLLLHLLMNSWAPHGLLQTWGIGGLRFGQVSTAIYLKISISDFLTLFSARAGPRWFGHMLPSPILVSAGVVALSISTIVASFWPDSYPDGVHVLGLEEVPGTSQHWLVLWIWLYCILWFLVQDLFKCAFFELVEHYNLFGYHSPTAIDLAKAVGPHSSYGSLPYVTVVPSSVSNSGKDDNGSSYGDDKKSGGASKKSGGKSNSDHESKSDRGSKKSDRDSKKSDHDSKKSDRDSNSDGGRKQRARGSSSDRGSKSDRSYSEDSS